MIAPRDTKTEDLKAVSLGTADRLGSANRARHPKACFTAEQAEYAEKDGILNPIFRVFRVFRGRLPFT